MKSKNFQTVAVVGAGMAGATCAQALVTAGYDVHVFDKSRAPGGRLATRRFRWDDGSGNSRVTPLDHGAIAFTARSEEFRHFVDDALGKGWLAGWKPTLASESLDLNTDGVFYVSLPDMPALCRRLLDGIPTNWSSQVRALRKLSSGWQIECADQGHPASFDAVVLAIPPAQAAALVATHRDDLARAASAIPMAPCWTLMGIEKGGLLDEPDWSLARPPKGPLAWVIRNDRRPGRAQVDGEVHWVAHAERDWTVEHLEHDAVDVERELKAALDVWLGRPVEWLASTVHRWRYGFPQAGTATRGVTHWWDASQRLGICGDFLAAGSGSGSGSSADAASTHAGVEGAWRSGRSMAEAIEGRSD